MSVPETPTPGPAGGPRVQRREAWLDLPPPYAGFKIRIVATFPSKFFRELDAAPTQADQAALLGTVVLEHNGWQDFDGVVYPQPGAREFWDEIPDELAAAVVALLRRERDALPNLILRTKR